MIVILSPHLDDAVYSAWHALGDETHVITVCTGLPDDGVLTRSDAIAGGADSLTVMQQRLAEDAAALAKHTKHVTRLGFPDTQYASSPLDPAAVGAQIGRIIATASIVYAPAGLGRHPDHLAVRDAVLPLVDEAQILRLYADMPYAVHYGWPHWVNGLPHQKHLNADAAWAHDLRDVSGHCQDPVVVRLDDLGPAKLDGMRQYSTQWPSLNHGSIRRLEAPEIYGYEVYWPVFSSPRALS